MIANLIHYTMVPKSRKNLPTHFYLPSIDQSFQQNKGLIILSTHNGDFILSAAKMAQHYPITLLIRYPKNKLIRKGLQRWLQRIGLHSIDRVGGVNRALQTLRNQSVLVFAMDQHAGKHGVWVDFFEEPTSTFALPAVLALRLGTPVHLAIKHTDPDGENYIWGSGAIPLIQTGDHEKDIVLNTARYAKLIEEAVRREEDTWIWMHQRWKPFETISEERIAQLSPAQKSRVRRVMDKYEQYQQWKDEVKAVQNDHLFDTLDFWRVDL